MALIFLDIETTGLDPVRDMILELAALRVDVNTFEPSDGFQAVISPQKSGVDMPRPDEYVTRMHTANGLFAEIAAGGGFAFGEVYAGLKAWLENIPDWKDGGLLHTLAGDSVHFDLGFLKIEMPDVAALFSHRLFDVSAFRVARELRGLPPCDIVGATQHRAAPDVMASIGKARWHLSRVVA